MGYYDKTDARTAGEGVWFLPDAYDFRHCYNASEAFEQAIVNAKGEIVGKVLTGFTTYPPQHLKAFGLEYRVRRIADVDTIQNARKAKRAKDAAARQAAKRYESVTTLTFDREWNLVGKTMEDRTVYTNKSGGMVIKTRSAGSPKVHLVDGKHVVVYYPHAWQNGRGETRYTNKPAKVLPDECPVLDNI